MKKQIIIILFLLGNLTTSFSKTHNNTLANVKTAFDDLVGTYAGFEVTKKGLQAENKISAELTADFNLKLTENFDGLLMEHINEKISPQDGELDDDGNFIFSFLPRNKASEFTIVNIYISKKPQLEGSNFLMTIVLGKGDKGEDISVYMVSKKGGNPKRPNKNISFSDIHTSVFHTGNTEENKFGDFQIEWYASENIGYLKYKNVVNVFKIVKEEKIYRVFNYNGEQDIEAEYILHKDGEGRLLKIKNGKKLFDETLIEVCKKYEKVGGEKEFLEYIGSKFYQMIHPQYKVKGNYTLTHNNRTDGKGIHIIMAKNSPVLYVGDFKNKTYHGEGAIYFSKSSEKGFFKNGKRHGHFYTNHFDEYVISGEYIDGEKEGLWKLKRQNNATFDLVYKDGKEVNRTATNQGTENTQIDKHVEDAQYQLKNSGRYIKEMVSIANGCSEITTMRSYQVCLRPLKVKIDLFSGTIVAADRELTKAIKEAKRVGCVQSLQVLKNAEDDLWEANGAFGKAYKAMTEVYHAKTVAKVEAEYRKCKAALHVAAKAMDEYFFWINSLALKTCYEYSATDKNTLPSRTSSQNKASKKSSTSGLSKNKTTPKKSTSITSAPVNYPVFSGKYEGDNLLLLMGRKIDDPAVQKLLKNPSYKFERIDRSGSLRKKIDYECNPYRFSLSFVNGVLTYISFKVMEWDKDHYFKKKLPLNIPLAKSTSAMQGMKDKWNGNSSNWTLVKYQLKFNVWGENDKICIVTINAEDVKDWNSYYQQFQ